MYTGALLEIIINDFIGQNVLMTFQVWKWMDCIFLARRKHFNPLLNQNASFSDFGHNILRGSFNHAKLMQ